MATNTNTDGDNTKIEHRTAYMTIYAVSRHYGGPEEGGWWYDSYTPEGTAIPFHAVITYVENTAQDNESEEYLVEKCGYQCFVSEDSNSLCYWYPSGIRVDEKHAFEKPWFDRAKQYLEETYGLHEDMNRGSMAQRKTDYVMILEVTPGIKAFEPRLHYE